jgi:hypothetical protein
MTPLLLAFHALAADFQCMTNTQPVDHFDARQTDIFEQLMCYCDNYTLPGAGLWDRMIIEIPDFTPINRSSPFSSSVLRLAQLVNATAVIAELRFIGDAWPENVTNSSAIVYDHATIEENVADIAYLIANRTANLANRVAFVVGGGYGGNLAAWSRLKFPQYISGAWASSAPIEARTFDDVYDQRFLKKLGQFGQCNISLPTVLRYVEGNMTSYGALGDSTRALFGLPPTIRNASALYVIYEALEMMNDRNDQHNILTSLCSSNFSLPILASHVNATLAYNQLTPEDLDPDAVASPTCPPKVRNRKQIWKTRCFDVGQFHIPVPGQPFFRSALLNASFYRDICSRTWDIADFGDTNVTNLRFGGRNSRAQSILFTMSQDDVALHLMLEEPKEWTEIIKRNDTQRGSPAADLREQMPGEDQSLTDARKAAIALAVAWINESCTASCSEHGSCLLHTCTCKVGFTGKNCTDVEVEMLRFKAVAIAAVIGPAIAVICTALLAWNTILTDASDFKPLSMMQSLAGAPPETHALGGRRRRE